MPGRVMLSQLSRAGAAALVVCLTLATTLLPANAKTHLSSAYTVTRRANGIQLSLRFDQRTYPQRGLVAVTVTLRNLSHPHLAVQSERLPYGICSWPAVTLTSVDASGRSVEPPPVIQPPAFPCAAPLPVSLPRGHAIVEHQLVELWSARLHATALAFNRSGNGFSGFRVPGPTALLHLSASTIPTIQTGTVGGITTATLVPASAAQTPVYYRSWGTCSDGEVRPLTVYWTQLQGATVSSGCTHPLKWHVDIGTLNGPVASLDLTT